MENIYGLDEIGIASGFKQESFLKEAQQNRVLKMAEATAQKRSRRRIVVELTINFMNDSLRKNQRQNPASETRECEDCPQGNCVVFKF
jgi:hypothetical protein